MVNKIESYPLLPLFKDFKTQTIIESHDLTILKDQIDKTLDEQEDYLDNSFEELSHIGSQEQLNKNQKFNQKIIEDIQWNSINQIAEDFNQLTFCKNEPDFIKGKLLQGFQMNVHILNALAVCCSNNDLYNALNPLKDDYMDRQLFLFRFYKNKYQKWAIIVDNRLPSISLHNKQLVPIFSRSSNCNEFFVSMIEKAYCKLHRSYMNTSTIQLRTVLRDFTGVEPTILNFNKNLDKNNFSAVIDYLVVNKSVVCFSNTTSNTFYRNKFFILKEIQNKNGTDTFCLINPWFGGDSLIKCRGEYKYIENLSFDLLQEHFNQIIIVKDYPKDWSGIKCEVSLSPSNGLPSATNPSWLQNPQFIFETSKPDLNLIFNVYEMTGIQVPKQQQVGFIILSMQEKEVDYIIKHIKLKVNNLNYDRLIYNCRQTDNHDNFQQKYLTIKEKGKYCLIPFSTLKDEISYLQFEIYMQSSKNFVKFNFKCDRILDEYTNEPVNSQPRVIADYYDPKQINIFNLSQQNQKNYDIMLPPNYDKILYSALKNNSKVQRPNEDHNAVEIYDPLLDNYKQNILYETLLGTNEYEDNTPFDNEKIQDIVDLNYFGLGKEGIFAIFPQVVGEKNIRCLFLSGNNITDETLIHICSELEAAHHFELEQLDVSDNNIGQTGAECLVTFIQRMKNLKVLNVSNNQQKYLLNVHRNINQKMLDKIDLNLRKKNKN